MRLPNKFLKPDDGGGDGGGGAAGQLGDGGTPPPEPVKLEGDTFRNAIPEEFREDPNLGNITSMHGLVSSFINAQKMTGANKIAIPSEHATEDDWRQFYQKVGLPEAEKDYSLEVPQEGADEKFVEAFKAEAFKAGILPKQAQALVNWYGQFADGAVKAQVEASQQAVQQEYDQFKARQGTAYQARLTRAQKAKDQFTESIPGFDEWMEQSGLSKHPKFIEFMMNVADQTVKEGSNPAGPGNTGMGMTVQQAQHKLQGIMGDLKHPYFDKKHPGHAAAVQEVTELHEVITPPTQEQA